MVRHLIISLCVSNTVINIGSGLGLPPMLSIITAIVAVIVINK